MKKVEVKTAKAIGPYSQAVAANGPFVFVSGQMPIDPVTGKLIEGDISAMTHRVLDNIEAVLHAAGSGLDKIVRAEIFLTDLKGDFAAVNAAYGSRISGSLPPARQTIGVSSLPLGAKIEISCIAVV